jgi:hypothetical protein
MHPPRRLIARFDVTLEIAEPRWVVRSIWIADWLRRVARVIERGDLPRRAGVGSPLAEPKSPTPGADAGSAPRS